LLGVFVGAVGELAGKSSSGHHAFALHALAGLARCHTGCGSEDHFLANLLGFGRMFLKIIGECLAHGLVHGTGHLAVSELGLGLSLKLWLAHLDGNHRCQSLTEVFSGNLYLSLLDLFGYLWVVVGIVFQHAGERLAEAGDMCTAFDGVDIVDV